MGACPSAGRAAEWPPGQSEPTDYWLSTLPESIPLRVLVRLAKTRWRIEHDYRELKDGLGLDHFEGRSSLVWHRHGTLAAVAHAICTQSRRTLQPPAQASPSTQSLTVDAVVSPATVSIRQSSERSW
jgi:SRSO17 transposase